jgi:hypothetical protein
MRTLVLVSFVLWLVLMIWVYQNSPEWFFVPFFFLTTFAYIRLMDASRSS